MDEPKNRQGAGKPDKAERLAEALRENLRKRKAQARARREAPGSSENRPQIDTDGGETGGKTG